LSKKEFEEFKEYKEFKEFKNARRERGSDDFASDIRWLTGELGG
jgi:hypothetical protein